MSRVDWIESEAEFIDFKFKDGETAIRAERCFPNDFATVGDATIAYRANQQVDEIREKLEAAGFEWTETESSLTEDEMWPTWPEDGEDEEDDEEEPEGPTP